MIRRCVIAFLAFGTLCGVSCAGWVVRVVGGVVDAPAGIVAAAYTVTTTYQYIVSGTLIPDATGVYTNGADFSPGVPEYYQTGGDWALISDAIYGNGGLIFSQVYAGIWAENNPGDTNYSPVGTACTGAAIVVSMPTVITNYLTQ